MTQFQQEVVTEDTLYHQQKAGKLDLKPRTSLTQYPWLLPGLLTLPLTYCEW